MGGASEFLYFTLVVLSPRELHLGRKELGGTVFYLLLRASFSNYVVIIVNEFPAGSGTADPTPVAVQLVSTHASKTLPFPFRTIFVHSERGICHGDKEEKEKERAGDRRMKNTHACPHFQSNS